MGSDAEAAQTVVGHVQITGMDGRASHLRQPRLQGKNKSFEKLISKNVYSMPSHSAYKH